MPFNFVTFFDYCGLFHLLFLKLFDSFSVIEHTQLDTLNTNFSNSSVYYNNQINYTFASTVPIVADNEHKLHQSTATSTWWSGSPLRLGWVEMIVGLPEVSGYTGHSLHANHFFAVLSSERPQKVSIQSL